MTRTAKLTLAGIVGAVVIFAVMAWTRRWISDDGLIYIRVVRNILDGNGPVFNAFERTEANTSALWPWLVAMFGAIKSGDLAPVAVFLGLACSIAGVAFALDGTRRWHRLRGSTAILVPASSLIVLACFPFWDYATSGLETGLSFLWLGVVWWLFVQLPRRTFLAAFVFGLGPLVRPDLGVVSAVFLAATWLLLRPSWRTTLALAGTAIALPFAFEIFRMGFYGVLVPLPALAKSATHAEWGRGWLYLKDFATPYLLWLPLAILVGMFGFVAHKRAISRRDLVVFAAPVVAAILIGLYVIRVGGDFMHARMFLPVVFLLVLPGFVLPLRRFSTVPLALLAGWALIVGVRLNDHENHATSPYVGDEHYGYVFWTAKPHPIYSADHIAPAYPSVGDFFDALAKKTRPFMTEGGSRYRIRPGLDATAVYAVGRLGMGGAAAPLDGIAADVLGLANPIGARITITQPDAGPGHQKYLPDEWLLADFADPDSDLTSGKHPARIAAARHAMTCGELRELLASVRDPLTPGRFWDNLTGAVRRTRLVIPADAVAAEEKFCGASFVPVVTASSSCERFGWSITGVIDGVKRTLYPSALGYSSEVWQKTDHTEWIELRLRTPASIKSVVLYPRDDPGFTGAGFPIDFTIQTWDGTAWVDRHTRTNTPAPTTPQTFAIDATVDRIRIHATRLQDVRGDGYVMQFAEIEIVR